MQCLRCHEEMKKFRITRPFEAYGKEEELRPMNIGQRGKLIDTVYICEKCGYTELNCIDEV